jgi:hypothetical protein
MMGFSRTTGDADRHRTRLVVAWSVSDPQKWQPVAIGSPLAPPAAKVQSYPPHHLTTNPRGPDMKKVAPIVILLLFCLLAWNVFVHPSGMSFDLDGEDVDGPLGAVLSLLFAGGGLIVAALVLLLVGASLALVFAGVGVLLALGLGLVALVLAAVMAPLLLPLLIPVVIVWFFVSRARRNRLAAQGA